MSFPTTQTFSRQARQSHAEMACWFEPPPVEKFDWDGVIIIVGVLAIIGFIWLAKVAL